MYLCTTIPVLLVLLPLPGQLPPLGDLSGNGVVDLRDFQEFTNWYGGIVIPPPPPPARLRADLNNDGRIDLKDHAILKIQLCGPDECCHCEHDADCYYGDPCKVDYCANGCCEHEDIPGCCRIDPDCDDYDFCTIACFLSRCLPEPLRACCFLNEECDDHTPCTVDTCEDFTCKFTHIPDCCGDPSDCDDGVACTRDECNNGTCVYTPDDSLCDDDIACTEDRCVDGICFHTPNDLLCNPGATAPGVDPDSDCVWNRCSALVGCVPSGFNDGELTGSPCDDGFACTVQDQCYVSIVDLHRTCTGIPDNSLCPNQDLCDADCITFLCTPGLGCVLWSEGYGNNCLRDCPTGYPCCNNDIDDPQCGCCSQLPPYRCQR